MKSKKILMFFIDFIILVVSFFLAFYIRNLWAFKVNNIVELYYLFFIVLIGKFLILFRFNVYDREDFMYAVSVFSGYFFMQLIFVMSISFFVRVFSISRALIIIFVFLDTGLSFLFRVFFNYFYGDKFLIIKDEEQLKQYLEDEEVKDVLICEKFNEILFQKLVVKNSMSYKKIYLMPSIEDIILTGEVANQWKNKPIIDISVRENAGFYTIFKPILDKILALIGLILLSPVMLIVAVLIKLDSRGSIFYLQTRVGKHGKLFKIIKFRTMREDAEAQTGPVISSGEEDDRVTRIGKILRKYHIDEFPQLINVLKGDMALVGPRPERPFFVEQFKKQFPAYELRFLVKPGITGLAQIFGTYHSTAEEKIKFDITYIKNQSLLLDYYLIYKTLLKFIPD